MESSKKNNKSQIALELFVDSFFPLLYWVLAYPHLTHNNFHSYLQVFSAIFFIRYGLKLFKSINLIVYANSLKNKKITVEKRNDQLKSIEHSNTLFNTSTISMVLYISLLYFLLSNLTTYSMLSASEQINSICILAILNFLMNFSRIFIKSKIHQALGSLLFISFFVISNLNVIFLISLIFNLIYYSDIQKKIGKLNYNLVQTSIVCNMCLLFIQLNFYVLT